MRVSVELCDAGVSTKHGHPDIARKDTNKEFLIMSPWTATKKSRNVVFFRLSYHEFYLQCGLFSQPLIEKSTRNVSLGIKVASA